MEGQRIVFNDGTTVENGIAGYSEGCLWLTLPGYSMQQAAAVAFDSGKTDHIVFQYGDMQDVYDNYTECVNIHSDYDGLVSVCLKRGVS